MPYTTDLLFDGPCLHKDPDKLPKKLSAETDTGAIAEAERLLRSTRVVAGVKGDDPPAAGVISKDGQEFVCVIVNPPTPEPLFAAEVAGHPSYQERSPAGQEAARQEVVAAQLTSP